jgi:hypothetical protein
MELGRRAAACVLAITITFTTVPPVAARDAILGTIVVSGTAFSSTPTTEWVQITATRPVVNGDRLKTEKDATLVVDFHQLGIVGLYENSEMWVTEAGTGVAVEARRGKVAFFLAPESPLKVNAGAATIAAGERKAEGFVEFNHHGPPELVIESDDMNVVIAGGGSKVFTRGDRVVLNDTLATVPAKATTSDERKAGAMEATPKKSDNKVAGLSPLGWTAIAGAVAAVGIGLGVGLSGGGGGGDDDNASE